MTKFQGIIAGLQIEYKKCLVDSMNDCYQDYKHKIIIYIY